jgi:hypothetical protein
MFLVHTFGEIVKNGPYISKENAKQCKNGPVRLFFFGSANEMLIWHIVDPTILILVLTFCETGKNGPYIF